MSPLNFSSVNNVLCIGAHVDDIEIGCGGALLQWLEDRPEIKFDFAVFTGDERRKQEAKHSFEGFSPNAANSRLHLFDFRDGFLPYHAVEVKEAFFQLRDLVHPDLILTHRLEDRHQDHSLLGQLTWNTFRDHSILEYEIPKYEGDLGQPNVFVPVLEKLAVRKAELIYESFVSQQGKPWFEQETFLSLMRVRGIECKAESGFAEAFTARKLTVQL